MFLFHLCSETFRSAVDRRLCTERSNPFEIVDDDEVAFRMIQSNVTIVTEELVRLENRLIHVVVANMIDD